LQTAHKLLMCLAGVHSVCGLYVNYPCVCLLVGIFEARWHAPQHNTTLNSVHTLPPVLEAWPRLTD
uniref:Uncharacterized protein n=1 Tax=Echeneis naucrates TaxID=173247 RepID=A0A665URV6_ECHNA